MSRLRLRGGVASSPPDPGDELTSGPGPTAGADWTNEGYAFAPVIRERSLYRTTLVTAGDEFIDLQSEVAIPASPTATTWTVTGSDIQYLALTDGLLTLNRTAIAGLTKPFSLVVTVEGANDNGSSSAFLTITVPADADCRFCSFVSGSDSNNGTTPALAWKRVPGCTTYTGSAVTLGAGKVLFFKAERHAYQLTSTSNLPLAHAGSSGNPMVYAMSGWGGRAIISGDDVITGWTTVTQGEVGGNANYANIRKLDLTAGSNGGAVNPGQHLFDGDTICYPAQHPVPAELWNFEVPTDTTEQGGMWRALRTTSTGTSPRISQSGTTVTIVDPRIAAVFGSNTPRYANVWGPNNEVTRCNILTYDQPSSTVTCTLPSGSINAGTSYGAYSFTHHPCQITQAGQYALSADGATVYAWLPENDVTSVARRMVGLSPLRSYVTVEGGLWRRFSSISSGSGGWAISLSPEANVTNITVRDLLITQCRSDDGNGVIYGSNATYTISNPTFERCNIFGDNPRSSGLRIGIKIHGYVDGTHAQVRAKVDNKIRWNYAAPHAIGRTFIYSSTGDGIHYLENCARDLYTVHGNGISLYADAPTAYNDNNVVEGNCLHNVLRGYTESMDTAVFANSRSNLITNNVFLGNTDGAAWFCYDGEKDTIVEKNIIMGAPGWDYPWAMGIDAGLGITVRNNVVAGISYDAANATAYAVNDNLLMVNLVPPNVDANKVATGNTVATGAPIKTWDGVMSAQMATRLGAGQYGIFWSIAA